MKKIVALVLSLVLALSLCATAFAYTGTVVYEKGADGKPDTSEAGVVVVSPDYTKAWASKDCYGNVEYYSYDNGDYVYYNVYELWNTTTNKLVDTKLVKAVETPADTMEFNCEVEGYTANPYIYTLKVKDGKAVVEKKWIEEIHYLIPVENKDDANCALYKNGAMVTWLYDTMDKNAMNYAHTAKAQAATTAKPNCTTDQYLEDGYVDVTDGTFYVDGTTTPLNVNGKIVWADKAENYNYVIHASHIFAKGVKNTKTGYDVATCLICKGEFACTNDELVATKNGYKISTGFSYSNADARQVYDANKYANGYDFAWGQTYASDYNYCWQLKPGTTEEIGTKPSTDKKTGVDSAKTFDAGIAMYVGMSLLSVAGSAVVIGKKKEF